MANPWTERPESDLARWIGASEADAVRARQVLRAVQDLPLPMDVRVAILVHLFDAPEVELGTTYAARFLALPPVEHLGELLDAPRVGRGRLADAVRALRLRDPAEFAAGAARRSAPERQSAPLADGRMRLQDIASSAGEQLTATHDELGRSRHPLRLGDVEVTVRGAMTQDDDEQLAMQFPEGLDAEAASQVVLRFRDPARVATPGGTAAVPDVRGYTRALAERKLRAAGLGASAAWMTTTNARQDGRVLRQRPTPGESVPAGQVVQLHLGRSPQPRVAP